MFFLLLILLKATMLSNIYRTAFIHLYLVHIAIAHLQCDCHSVIMQLMYVLCLILHEGVDRLVLSFCLASSTHGLGYIPLKGLEFMVAEDGLDGHLVIKVFSLGAPYDQMADAIVILWHGLPFLVLSPTMIWSVYAPQTVCPSGMYKKGPSPSGVDLLVRGISLKVKGYEWRLRSNLLTSGQLFLFTLEVTRGRVVELGRDRAYQKIHGLS
ncbi:hypothetical protein FNV43_RR15467 [Rhamnella rubrinervis]|uniref:Uncharacterized protein n=1 Tax=Rhamnella rubrinervis TaxID=2594499 RepID=A0A8K0GXG4_9ROSA|nr:hypothetical protein FNV43_RR15467 [Rhamnella rubrinervis]